MFRSVYKLLAPLITPSYQSASLLHRFECVIIKLSVSDNHQRKTCWDSTEVQCDSKVIDIIIMQSEILFWRYF